MKSLFVGVMLTTNSVFSQGVRLEVFPSHEFDGELVAGDKVLCMFVNQTQEVQVLEKIA